MEPGRRELRNLLTPSPPCTISEALLSPLSRFADCWMEMRCGCRRSAVYPVKLLIERRGDIQMRQLVRRMRCKQCGERPTEAYLQETDHRAYPIGTDQETFAAPGWALRLVGGPQISAI